MSPSLFNALPLAGAALLLMAACSPEPSSAPEENLTATMPEKVDAQDLEALKQQQQLQHDAFMVRCRAGNLPSQDGQAADAAQCQQAFEKADHSKGAADQMIKAFMPNGAAKASTLDAMRQSLAGVKWSEQTTGGSTLASGTYGDFEAVITGQDKPQKLSFNWSGPAGEMPVNIVDAFTLYEARAELVACQTGGVSEQGRLWRVTPATGPAFNVEEFSHIGPSGTAVSSYSASASFDTVPLTLEALRKADSEWSVCG